MGVLKAKVGGTWVEIPGSTAPSAPASYPRGFVDWHQNATIFATTGTHTTFQHDGMQCTLDEPVGRIWRITYMVPLYVPGGVNSISVQLQRNGVGLITFDVPSEALALGYSHHFTFPWVIRGTAGGAGVVYRTMIKAQNNTQVSTYTPRQLVIEDIGGV